MVLLIATAMSALAWYDNSYWPGSYGDYRYTPIVYQPYMPYWGSGFSPFNSIYYHYSYRYYSSEPQDYYRGHYYRYPYYRNPYTY